MKHLLMVVLLASSLALAEDISIYRGLATTHLVSDNDIMNNSNGVTIIGYGNIFAGVMTNSYGNHGEIAGYQRGLYSGSNFGLSVGLAVITGYEKWQVSFFSGCHGYDLVECQEQQVLVMPVIAAKYVHSSGVGIQAVNMGEVINAGLLFEF